MILEKDFKTQIQSHNASESDMSLINRFTRKALTADEVYIFGVKLCDNEIDRDFERFDTPALKSLAEMFVGKTGIFDHSMKGRDQISRLYSAELVTDSLKKNSVGEPYAYIKAMAYMPRTDKNAELISEIEAGIKKEVSISCSMGSIVCSECGADLMHGFCEHIKGKEYGGSVCHAILKNPSDAYEWSFVAVPAQPAAGVTKSFVKKKEVRNVEEILKAVKSEKNDITLSKSELDSLRCAIAQLESRAADGDMYKSALITEAVRTGLVSMPQINGDMLRSICEKLSTAELSELSKAFGANAEKNVPLNVQLRAEHSENVKNDEFKI